MYWVMVRDAIGNQRYLFASDLSTLGFPTTLTVSSTLQDVSPPSLSAFSFLPTSVSTDNGSASVTVSFTVTDDLTGATSVAARFCNPSSSVCSDGGSDFAATSSQTGSFEITFPQYSEAGI